MIENLKPTRIELVFLLFYLLALITAECFVIFYNLQLGLILEAVIIFALSNSLSVTRSPSLLRLFSMLYDGLSHRPDNWIITTDDTHSTSVLVYPIRNHLICHFIYFDESTELNQAKCGVNLEYTAFTIVNRLYWYSIRCFGILHTASSTIKPHH